MAGLLHEVTIFPMGGICTTCRSIKGSELSGAAAYRYISDLHPMVAMAKDGGAARIYGPGGLPAVPAGVPGAGRCIERIGVGTPQGCTDIAGRRVGGAQAKLPA